jgi:hypothetical protein
MRLRPWSAVRSSLAARWTKHAGREPGLCRRGGVGPHQASTGHRRDDLRFNRSDPSIGRDSVGIDGRAGRRLGTDGRDGDRRIANRRRVARRTGLELHVSNREHGRRRNARGGCLIAYRRGGVRGSSTKKDDREAKAPNEAPDREATVHVQKQRAQPSTTSPVSPCPIDLLPLGTAVSALGCQTP